MVFQGLDQRPGGSGLAAVLRLDRGSRAAITRIVAAADVRPRAGAISVGRRRSSSRTRRRSCCRDDRPGAPADNVFWRTNQDEAGRFLHGYESTWLPAVAARADDQRAAGRRARSPRSRHWTHVAALQQGPRRRAGRGDRRGARHRDEPGRDRRLRAGDQRRRGAAGLPGHRRPRARSRRSPGAMRANVAAAMGELRKLVPSPGSYVSEATTSRPTGSSAFWGDELSRGCGGEGQGTIRRACSSSTTASAARTGAPTASRA